jgi:hypothetical protein
MWKPDTPGARARNEAVRASKYLGRALWRNLTGDHRRSRVETIPLVIFRSEIHCRSADALCETAWSAPLGARLRSSGCGDPNPRSDPERLHSPRHTAYCGCRLNPSGVRGSGTADRFVQQSRSVVMVKVTSRKEQQ